MTPEPISSERQITFEAAWDKRDPNPNKNYGIHGVTVRFLLKRNGRAVQFVLYTNWQLPHVTEEQLNRPADKSLIRCFWLPMPSDLGYHSPVPMYEGQGPMSSRCAILDGTCYYDGSGLNAKPIYETLLREGDAGVWRELEKYYEEIFGARHD